MADSSIQRERARNLWNSFARKFPPLEKVCGLDAEPDLKFGAIGGIANAKEELLTYACAATNPEVYAHWGTFPPSGLLLIGNRGVGKSLLARALANQTQTAFLWIEVPALAIEITRFGGNLGELLAAWSQTLEEIGSLTVFFNELEFLQTDELGGMRTDLPIGPIMDFLLDLVDRSRANPKVLLLGSTSQPDTVRRALVAPGRFERVVEVIPQYPGDIIETLQLHAAAAEKRAGRQLFDGVDWDNAVLAAKDLTPGEWVRLLHAVLRHKARCEAADEDSGKVTTEDLRGEAERVSQAQARLAPPGGGTYL